MSVPPTNGQNDQEAPATAAPRPPPRPNPKLTFDNSALPLSHLESLRFKANQMMDSIQFLQATLEANGQINMPAWPDILAKYNVLLSQLHNFSNSLESVLGDEKVVVHPEKAFPEGQFDELAGFLGTIPETWIWKAENETVFRLSEHMNTRGFVGIKAPPSMAAQKPEYSDVMAECEQIKEEHDRRVERAVRAVNMLRDKYDWHARVAVEQEEPEEIEWDPTAQEGGAGAGEDGDEDTEGDESEDEEGEGVGGAEGEGVQAEKEEEGDEDEEDEDEMEMEDVLGQVSRTPDKSSDAVGTPPPSADIGPS